MAIYRPSKPRYRLVLIAAAIGLLVGIVTGLVLGNDEPDPVESVREISVTLTEASSVLEIVEIEYEEALEDGTGEGDAEYEGALDALARSRTSWTEVRPAVELLAPETASEVDALYGDLDQAMTDEALPEEINELTGELSELLDPETQ